MNLSGEQLQAFDNALRATYRTRAQLRTFLRYKLDKKLDDITGNDDLESVVSDLLERAEADGWLKQLYEKACEDKPQSPSLKHLQIALGLSSPTFRQSSYELLDTSNFDLRDLVDIFWRVRYHAGTGGILGFLARNMEDVVLGNLCKRLEQALDPAARKGNLTLSAEMNSIDRPLQILNYHKQDLAFQNVICVVRVDGETDAFEQFWRALTNEFQELKYFLVLIFTGIRSTPCLAGITELPTPKFERYQIAEWTSEISQRLLGWPQTEAIAWAELIAAKSLIDHQRLDPNLLFDTLEEAIKAIRSDQASYYSMLKGRSQGAIQTSN
jgi:hypothetical protein